VKRTKQVVVAAVAVAALALALVPVAGSAGAQSSVRGVTSTEIKVGGLGYAAFYADAGKAAKARFDAANSSGEIPGGRKINYIGFSDDNSNADQNLQKGRAMVDQDQVFAAVPVITPFLQSGSYLQQQKVPTIGWGISSAYCDATITYIFGFSGCLVPPPPQKYAGNTWGELVGKQLQAQGKGGAKGKAAAVISENNDSGKSGIEVIAATAEAVGMKVVYKEAALPPPPTSITDYSPYVQALMTSNGGQPPDVIFLVISQGNVFGLGRALNQGGFKGIQTNAVGYAPQLTSTANGWSVFTQFATPESTASSMTKIVSQLKAAGVDPIGQPALAGYYSADMFVGVLKKVGKNLTPEAFQKAAAKFTYQIPDVVGPTVYPAAYQASTPCGQLVTSNGTAWTITAPFGCYDLLTPTKNGKYKEVPYPSGVKPR
jgi:hypothetical protein